MQEGGLMINKIEMSEEDVRAKYIDPSIRNAGWNEETQIRREFSFTDGRIFVKYGKVVRGKRKKSRLYSKLQNKF